MPSRHSHSYGPGLSRSLSVSVLPPLSLCLSSSLPLPCDRPLPRPPPLPPFTVAGARRRASSPRDLRSFSLFLTFPALFPLSLWQGPAAVFGLRPTARAATCSRQVPAVFQFRSSDFASSRTRPFQFTLVTLVGALWKETSRIIRDQLSFVALIGSREPGELLVGTLAIPLLSVALYAYSQVSLCWRRIN